jgi:transcriptional regulator with XRE-family HTH domain
VGGFFIGAVRHSLIGNMSEVLMLHSACAAVLQRWRGKRSYRDVAGAAGLPQSTVFRVLTGEDVPREETIEALCSAFGRTQRDLIQAMADEVAS